MKQRLSRTDWNVVRFALMAYADRMDEETNVLKASSPGLAKLSDEIAVQAREIVQMIEGGQV
jgi:hypothetical protein